MIYSFNQLLLKIGGDAKFDHVAGLVFGQSERFGDLGTREHHAKQLSLDLNEWCFTAKSKHHSTSACRVAVVVQIVCMLVVGLLAVDCEERAGKVEGAVEVDGVDVAVGPAQNSDSGSWVLRPRILAWWLVDSLWELTTFTPIQVIFIVFLQTLHKASRLFPTTGLSQSLNRASSSQRSENLHLPIFTW